MSEQDNLYQIADELRAIASTGLHYSDSGYDKERYEHVLRVSARLVAGLESTSAEAIYTQYSGNLAHISPVLCVETVVFREGKILLIQRSDDYLWAMPGGLAEVGETFAQAAERELWEEAGMRGKADRLLGLFDSRLWKSRSRMHLCIVMFLLTTADIPVLHASDADGVSPFSEALDVGFFAEDELPGLSAGHDLRVPMVFQLMRGVVSAPFFDR
jgi:8-oxo-dGTP pyrophosphatase MutT (NUDIX family)